MTNESRKVAPGRDAGGYPSSCQVSWFSVFGFAERWASGRGLDLLDHNLLIPGTPQWCDLPDDDARKLLALILGGVREALTHDVAQGHRAEAAQVIAESTNWSTQANRLRGRSGAAYIPRKAS